MARSPVKIIGQVAPRGLKPVFLGATPRPVTPKYPQVTLVLQSEVSRALVSGDVKGALETARERIEAIVKA